MQSLEPELVHEGKVLLNQLEQRVGLHVGPFQLEMLCDHDDLH